MRLIYASILVSMLAACGGGGGGGGGGSSSGSDGGAGSAPQPAAPVPTPQAGLVFDPATVNVTVTEGEDPKIEVNVRAEKTFEGVVNVAIVDSQGIFAAAPEVRAWSPTYYTAYLRLARGLKPGVYSGALTVKLCKDAAAVCAAPHAGSPWSLPFRIEVKAFGSSLTTLKADPGAADWLMGGGSKEHRNYVNTTVEPARITARFNWSAPGADRLSRPVVQAGVAYVATPTTVYAIDEQTGTLRWQHQPQAAPYRSELTQPAVLGSRLYVGVAGGDYSYLDTIDSASGAALARQPINQPSVSSAPTVDAGLAVVKLDGGSFQAVGASNFAMRMPSHSAWPVDTPPVVAGNAIYGYSRGLLYVFDRATGAQLRTISSTSSPYGPDNGRDMMLLDERHLGIIENDGYGDAKVATLTVFDIGNGTVAWSKKGGVQTMAAAGTTLYAAVNGQVIAFDAANGAQKWTWDVPASLRNTDGSSPVYSVLATNNVLFVSFADAVHAIDLSTQRSVWTAQVGGHLALSKNGVLYLSKQGAPLRAFNVR